VAVFDTPTTELLSRQEFSRYLPRFSANFIQVIHISCG
jgi:hypothetical protein